MSKQHPHIKTLRQHNKWRRGASGVAALDPKEIGVAIDWAATVAELAQKLIEAQPAKAGRWLDRLQAVLAEGRA